MISQLVCNIGPMPSIDPGAKAFQMDLAARFGSAVSARRKALKRTASEVARRTAELGYPVSRGAIAQIESNSRSGKVDVAELLILSLALDIPPVLLLFDKFPSSAEPVEVLPGLEASVEDGVRWVSGLLSSPRRVVRETFQGVGKIIRTAPGDRYKPPNEGVQLITSEWSYDKALLDRVPLVIRLENAQNDGGDTDAAERMLELHDEYIAGLENQIVDSREALWALSSDAEEPESDE